MNIYVGNLPRSTSEEAIRKMFEEFGEVNEVKLIKDQYSGELRGFGFVQMPAKAEAQAAIDGINSKELDGRHLIVNEAKPKKSNGRSGGNRSGGGGGFRGNRSRSW